MIKIYQADYYISCRLGIGFLAQGVDDGVSLGGWHAAAAAA